MVKKPKSSKDEANREAYKSTLSVVLESEKISEGQEIMLEKLRKKLTIPDEVHYHLYAQILNEQIPDAKEAGDTEKVLDIMGRSLEADPSQEALWREKGVLLGETSRYEEAIHAFTQALMIASGVISEETPSEKPEEETAEEPEEPEEEKVEEPEEPAEEKVEEPEEPAEEKVEEPDEPEEEKAEEPDVEFEMDEAEEEEGLLADDDWDSDDDILGEEKAEEEPEPEEKEKEPLHYIECPKCGADVPVYTKDRPITIECSTCGAKGRLTKPYDEEDKSSEEEKPDTMNCPKCGEIVEIPSKERPVVINCEACGAKGRLTK